MVVKKDINYSKLYCSKGKGYTKIKSYSHYKDPINTKRPHGNSRIWGDASYEVQREVIDTIIRVCKENNLTVRQTAHVLAIAHVESGFNPDAAAGSSSAAGLGQFVNKTGAAYGLDESNRFDIEANATALVRHFISNMLMAKLKGYKGLEMEERIYAYHHDGPSLKYGGLELSREKVMPLVSKIETILKG